MLFIISVILAIFENICPFNELSDDDKGTIFFHDASFSCLFL